MKESIRRMILRLFPELKANLHVPIYGVVSSIPDPPEKNVVTDSFRPYYGCTATVSSDWTNINYSFGIHEERGVFVDIKPPMWDAAVQGAKVIKKMVEDENE